MIAAARVILVVITALAAGWTALAFASQHSLTDNSGFVAAVDSALDDPAVVSELQATITKSTEKGLAEAAAGGGIAAAAIAAIGPDQIAESTAKAVTSGPFRQAWSQWAGILQQGLADSALGIPNIDVSVSGSQISVKIGPLAGALLGDGALRVFAGPIEGMLGNRAITFDTKKDTQADLARLGGLAGSRWIALPVMLVAGLAALAIGVRPLFWASMLTLSAGGVVILLGIWFWVAPSSAPTDTEFPALSAAIGGAMTSWWPLTFAVIGGLLLLIGLAFGWWSVRRRTTAPEQVVS